MDAVASGAHWRSQGELNLVSDLRRADERSCCGRQSRVVLAPVAGVKLAEASRPDRAWTKPQSADDGDKTNSSPGRARNKPLKPLRVGMPGDSGGPSVTTLVCLFHFCTRGCGCIGHPAFPTPSVGRKIHANLGRIAPRECERVFEIVVAV